MIHTLGQTVTVSGQIMTIEDTIVDKESGQVSYFLTDGDGHSKWYSEFEVD